MMHSPLVLARLQHMQLQPAQQQWRLLRLSDKVPCKPTKAVPIELDVSPTKEENSPSEAGDCVFHPAYVLVGDLSTDYISGPAYVSVGDNGAHVMFSSRSNLPSVGSAEHAFGRCSPCTFFTSKK